MKGITMNHNSIVIITVLLVSAISAYAQTPSAAMNTMPLVPADAAGVTLGAGYCAYIDTGNAIFFNPANLADLKSREFSFGIKVPPANYGSFSFSMPVKKERLRPIIPSSTSKNKEKKKKTSSQKKHTGVFNLKKATVFGLGHTIGAGNTITQFGIGTRMLHGRVKLGMSLDIGGSEIPEDTISVACSVGAVYRVFKPKTGKKMYHGLDIGLHVAHIPLYTSYTLSDVTPVFDTEMRGGIAYRMMRRVLITIGADYYEHDYERISRSRTITVEEKSGLLYDFGLRLGTSINPYVNHDGVAGNDRDTDEAFLMLGYSSDFESSNTLYKDDTVTVGIGYQWTHDALQFAYAYNLEYDDTLDRFPGMMMMNYMYTMKPVHNHSVKKKKKKTYSKKKKSVAVSEQTIQNQKSMLQKAYSYYGKKEYIKAKQLCEQVIEASPETEVAQEATLLLKKAEKNIQALKQLQ